MMRPVTPLYLFIERTRPRLLTSYCPLNSSIGFHCSCSIIFFFIVRIIGFHESPSCSRLVLLHLLAGVALGLLVRLDVARNTQRFEVRWVVCQPLHLLLGLGRFDRCLVVHVNGSGHESFALAPLTQRMLLKVRTSQLLPSSVIQQSLVSWITAHGSTSNGRTPSINPSSASPLNSPSLSCNSGSSGTSLSSKWMRCCCALSGS